MLIVSQHREIPCAYILSDLFYLFLRDTHPIITFVKLIIILGEYSRELLTKEIKLIINFLLVEKATKYCSSRQLSVRARETLLPVLVCGLFCLDPEH